ncbi:hypothetical protein ACF0H5_011517 [Mactra antiquata]
MSESVKTPEAEGNTKKEVDKLRLQVHGLWILVVLLAAIIVVPFVYPQKNCSGSNDGIEDIRKQLDEVSKQIGNKMGGTGKINVEGKGSIYDRLDKIDDVLKDHFANQAKEKYIDNKIKKLNVSSHERFEVMQRELLSVFTNLTELVSDYNQTKTSFNDLSVNMTQLGTNLEGFKGKINGELTNKHDILAENLTKIENQLEIVNENISNMTVIIHSNITGLVSEHNQTKTVCNSLTSNVTVLDTGLKDLKDELDKNLTDINDVLGKRFTNIKKQLDIFNETIPTIVLDLSEAQNAVKELVTNLTKLNTSVDTNGQTFTKELDKIFELLDNKIKQVTNESSANHALVMKEFEEFMNKSKNLSEDVMKLDKATKEVKELLNETTEVTSLLRSHALNKTNVIILVSIIFFLLFALAFWIYNLHNKVNNKSGTTTTTRKEVLQKLSRPSRLESSVCLIGFNKYMSTFQQNLVKRVVGNIPVTTTVISSHSQLLELPHCRLYVMCIEFSERHVILEEPGLGLGDLKKTTHDVTKKLSDDLIIIYTHDPGSKSLPQGQLYNNNIHCVSSKPELTTLRSLNRFYSIYDKFTDYQIHTLKTTVDNCLEK